MAAVDTGGAATTLEPEGLRVARRGRTLLSRVVHKCRHWARSLRRTWRRGDEMQPRGAHQEFR